MTEEISSGGSNIYRHKPQAVGNELSPGDPELITAVEAHLDRCLGGTDWVLHEILSPGIHVDVHIVPPSDSFPFHRLVTSGMAEAPMTVPPDFPYTRFAELTIALPRDWPMGPMDEENFKDERAYWPIRLLKWLSRLPHDYSTFLWYGHTIPNDDPPKRYARGTDLCGALITRPRLAPHGFEELELPSGRSVVIPGIIPLHKDEMRFKLDRGHEALEALLDEHGIVDLVDPSRPSVAPKRRGFFRGSS